MTVSLFMFIGLCGLALGVFDVPDESDALFLLQRSAAALAEVQVPNERLQSAVKFRDTFIVEDAQSSDEVNLGPGLDMETMTQARWYRLCHGLVQITINDARSDVCGVGMHARVYCRGVSDGWRPIPEIPGGASYVAMNDDFLVALDMKGRVFRFQLPSTRQGATQKQQWRRITSNALAGHAIRLRQIAVGNSHILCGITFTDELFCREEGQALWQRVNGFEGKPKFVALNQQALYLVTQEDLVVHKSRRDLWTDSSPWQVVAGVGKGVVQVVLNNRPSPSRGMFCERFTDSRIFCQFRWQKSKPLQWHRIPGKAETIAANDRYLLAVTKYNNTYIRLL